jgi:hypothetical protein
MSLFDGPQTTVGAQRHGRMLMMSRERLGVARCVEDDAPRFVELPVRDGLRWQRLRS